MGWFRRTSPADDRPLSTVTDRRRSGPAGELPWWDPVDQAFVERVVIPVRALSRGWSPAPMVNNVEVLDPYADLEASVPLRAARQERQMTALDEGSALRHRRTGSLIVTRLEVFADPDDRAHREAWRTSGPASLEELWRSQWRTRGLVPGWIEARWRQTSNRPSSLGPAITVAPSHPGADQRATSVAAAVDWITVEDQTGWEQQRAVTTYEHLTVWAGRAHATVTVRHHQHEQVDGDAVAAVLAVWACLGRVSL